MKIIKDIDLIYDVKKYDVILIGTSTLNSLGNGFQYKMGKNFPIIKEANNSTLYADKSKLGTVQVVNESPIICLCYIHNGRFRPDINPDVVDYAALEKCLKLINQKFKGLKVATTIIGNSPFEGGGDYNKCLGILQKQMVDVDLYVYDYKQLDYRYEDNLKYHDIVERRKANKITKEEYYEEKKKYLWERNFGLYTPLPNGVSYHELKKIIKAKKICNNDK